MGVINFLIFYCMSQELKGLKEVTDTFLSLENNWHIIYLNFSGGNSNDIFEVLCEYRLH